MVEHLEQQCLALTARHKKKKMQDVNIPWDRDNDIKTYFFEADKLEEDLQDHYGIEWPTIMKITQAEDEMYRSNMFTKEELITWEEKPMADKTWFHLRTYFKDRWTTTMVYQVNTPHKHGFEISASAEEDSDKHRLASNLREVAVAATADKEHIQQMTIQNDDLLRVVRKQQSQIDKHQTQIEKLLKQNGQLINKIVNNTSTGGPTNAGAENTHRGRYLGNRNNSGNSNTNSNETRLDTGASTITITKNCPKCAVFPLFSQVTAGCWELDKNKSKIPDNWSTLLE